MDTRTCPDEYVWSQEFEDNLKKQAAFVETYKRMKSPWSYSPYHEWNDFLERYTHFRACLASLRNNPDTKDDADFKELCEMWNHYKDSFHPRIGIKTGITNFVKNRSLTTIHSSEKCMGPL